MAKKHKEHHFFRSYGRIVLDLAIVVKLNPSSHARAAVIVHFGVPLYGVGGGKAVRLRRNHLTLRRADLRVTVQGCEEQGE